MFFNLHKKPLKFFSNVISLLRRVFTGRWFQIQSCTIGYIFSSFTKNNSTTCIVKINLIKRKIFPELDSLHKKIM